MIRNQYTGTERNLSLSLSISKPYISQEIPWYEGLHKRDVVINDLINKYISCFLTFI